MLSLVLLSGYCIAAVYADLRAGRVPNPLCAGALFSGLALSVATRGLGGLFDSLLGSILGLGILLIPFLLRMVGGGDAKFLAAAGAIIGWRAIWPSFLIGASIGGIVAIIVFLRKDRSFLTLRHRAVLLMHGILRETEPLSRKKDSMKLPYAVPLAAGLMLFNLIRAFC